MIKTLYYCDRCGKQTEKLARVYTDLLATGAERGRNIEICAECSRKLNVFLDGGKLAVET